MSNTLRYSPSRVLTALVLGSWAGLFWWLLLSGRTALYLSARTDWVVPLGAVTLTIAAVGRFVTARTPIREELTRRGAWGLGLLLVPVVTVAALPPSTLGAYAASRRSSFIGAGFQASASDIESGELSLIDLAGAARSPAGMQALSRRAGSEVKFVGFVVRDRGMPVDEFMLTRFIVSCCAADALSIQVRVVGVPPGKFTEDDWVQVTGSMYPLGRDIIVQASDVIGVEAPERPYITP
ncbi:MAG: TIGR03943 family putative permease subunit [Actinomycetota bacterium]